MTYSVEFTAAAARQVRKLPRPARDRVLDAIDGLAGNPRPHGAKKLVGEQTAWRIRIGDYRVHRVHRSSPSTPKFTEYTEVPGCLIQLEVAGT